jgi:anthranilate phosphoribosyltransferase
MWCPYAGAAQIVAGYVHPPTEHMFQVALSLRGENNFTTVKGLEGSCDLPRERTNIIGLSTPDITDEMGLIAIERLHLSPRDYGFSSHNVLCDTTEHLVADMRSVLQGKPSEMMQSAIWNGGFYLWRAGICPNVSTGITQAASMFASGEVAQQLMRIVRAVESIQTRDRSYSKL